MSALVIALAWTRVVAEPGDWQVDGGERGLAAVQIRAVRVVVRELDAGQRVGLVDLLSDPSQRRVILVVPDAQLDERGDVRGGVDLDLLDADHGPAALGLDPAHRVLRGGIAVVHAVAVRHLEEPVLVVSGPIRTGSNKTL
jgi:hypothetical protein